MSAAALPASYTLSTHARHQYRSYYCGPATVQIVSNYTWDYRYTSVDGEASSTNKYQQTEINANWTHATSSDGTSLANFVDGMNSASVLPFGSFYMQWQKPSWSEFQNAIATDTSTWFMPLAAGVNPKKTGSSYYLYSWRTVPAATDRGHYITLRGYSGFVQASAIAYYNDSSGGKDEVTGVVIYGSTGAFQDLSYTVYKTMMNRYGNLVW